MAGLYESRVNRHHDTEPRAKIVLEGVGIFFTTFVWTVRLRRGRIQWGLCALRHGIQISMEAILACHPARSTE